MNDSFNCWATFSWTRRIQSCNVFFVNLTNCCLKRHLLAHFSRQGWCEFVGQPEIFSSVPQRSSLPGRFPVRPGPRRHLPGATVPISECASAAPRCQRPSGRSTLPWCRSFPPSPRRQTYFLVAIQDWSGCKIGQRNKREDLREAAVTTLVRLLLSNCDTGVVKFINAMNYGTWCSKSACCAVNSIEKTTISTHATTWYVYMSSSVTEIGSCLDDAATNQTSRFLNVYLQQVSLHIVYISLS